MRDFLPGQVRKREFVIGAIKSVYEKYGFEPLETPAVENLATLTNKYGDEGDQLMFKILKRGEKLARNLERGGVRSEDELSDLALRYDLTVPLARVIANNRNDLPKFFKRYQIQPVWRADRPARGRFREFYQCDVDTIGSDSVLVEAELCSAVGEIFDALGLDDIRIKVNHKGLLFALLEACGVKEEIRAGALVALDKLDKIGTDAVSKELLERGVEKASADALLGLFESNAGMNATASLSEIEQFVGEIPGGKTAIRRLTALLELTGDDRMEIDASLARGLSYYTGTIVEVVLTSGGFEGAVAGGGRYDGLIGMFGKEQIPAVGLSLGLERILMIMEERGLFPAEIETTPVDVMVTVWSEETYAQSFETAAALRGYGHRVLLYPQADKLGKQFKYADQLGIRFVCVLGEDEIEKSAVTVKNLESGTQKTVPRDEAAGQLVEN